MIAPIPFIIPAVKLHGRHRLVESFGKLRVCLDELLLRPAGGFICLVSIVYGSRASRLTGDGVDKLSLGPRKGRRLFETLDRQRQVAGLQRELRESSDRNVAFWVDRQCLSAEVLGSDVRGPSGLNGVPLEEGNGLVDERQDVSGSLVLLEFECSVESIYSFGVLLTVEEDLSAG
jgi:hypothetical protein